MKWSVNRTPVIGKSFVFRESQVFLSPICFLSRFYLKYFMLLFYLREIFLYVSFQILREKSVKIDKLALVRRLATVFPRELGGSPGYEYIDQELQSERERFSSLLSLSIRKYPWKRATTRDPNGTLRLFANSPLGRNTADNRSGVTGWSYKI